MIAKALRAGFRLVTHRALPRPVGSRDRVTRYRHLSAACLSVGCYRHPYYRRLPSPIWQSNRAAIDVIGHQTKIEEDVLRESLLGLSERFTGSGQLARARPTEPVPPPQPSGVGSKVVLVDLGADDPCIGPGRAL